MAWPQPDQNAANYPQDPYANDPLRRWWMRQAKPWLRDFGAGGDTGSTKITGPGTITQGASGLAGLAGPLAAPAQQQPQQYEAYGPDPAYGPTQPATMVQAQAAAARQPAPRMNPTGASLSALAPASSGAPTPPPPPIVAEQPGLADYRQGEPMGNSTNDIAAPDRLQQLYDRLDQMQPGRAPSTETEMADQKSEDRRTAIAMALLTFAQHAAGGKGYQGIAEGIPAGGVSGLGTWSGLRKEARVDQEKAQQQQYANQIGRLTLATQAENAQATRDLTAQTARERLDFMRQAAGETAADRRARIAEGQATRTQQGSQFDRTLALKRDEMNKPGGGGELPADMKNVDGMVERGIASTPLEAWNMRKQALENPMAAKAQLAASLNSAMQFATSDEKEAEFRKQWALISGEAAPAGQGGGAYKGEAAPAGVPGAQRLPDGRWAAPGPDGVLREILQ